MTDELPADLDAVLRLLPPGWILGSLERGNMSWAANLKRGAAEYLLVSDRGYLELYELAGGKQTFVPAPGEHAHSVPPETIAAILRRLSP